MVRCKNHKAPRYAVLCSSQYHVPVRFNYSPQHPILEHPQPTFLLQYERMVSHPYKTTDSVIVVCIVFFINIFG